MDYHPELIGLLCIKVGSPDREFQHDRSVAARLSKGHRFEDFHAFRLTLSRCMYGITPGVMCPWREASWPTEAQGRPTGSMKLSSPSRTSHAQLENGIEASGKYTRRDHRRRPRTGGSRRSARRAKPCGPVSSKHLAAGSSPAGGAPRTTLLREGLFAGRGWFSARKGKVREWGRGGWGGRVEGPHIHVPRRVNTDGEALAEPRFALVIPVTEDLAGLSADYHGWRGRRSGRAAGQGGTGGSMESSQGGQSARVPRLRRPYRERPA